MKLAITRVGLWFLVSVVLFQSLLTVLSHDASWRSYVSLAVALGMLLLVYTEVLVHVRTSSRNSRTAA